MAKKPASANRAWTKIAPEEIRAFREQHEISRSRLARALGVSSTTIQNWETGNGVAMPKLQARVAELIRLGPAALGASKGTGPDDGPTWDPGAAAGPQMTAAAQIVTGYVQATGGKLSTEELLELIKSVRGALK